MVNLHRSGRPNKITPRAHQQLIQEVRKERTADLTRLSVHDSTVRARPSSKEKTSADQEEHKGSSHICQKKISMISKIFGEIFCGLMRKKLNLLEGLSLVTSGVKEPHGNSQTWWWCDGLGLLRDTFRKCNLL